MMLWVKEESERNRTNRGLVQIIPLPTAPNNKLCTVLCTLCKHNVPLPSTVFLTLSNHVDGIFIWNIFLHSPSSITSWIQWTARTWLGRFLGVGKSQDRCMSWVHTSVDMWGYQYKFNQTRWKIWIFSNFKGRLFILLFLKLHRNKDQELLKELNMSWSLDRTHSFEVIQNSSANQGGKSSFQACQS